MQHKGMNIIAYCRVSTDEQAEKGFSLSYQEEALKRYCDQNGHNLIDVYREDFTGFKDFNRPQWLKIENFVKKNKGKIQGILCLRWDRFSRNEPEASSKLREFKKKGIEIFMTESYADPKSIEGDFLNSIHMHMAQMESKKISQRTKEGMRRGMIEGYWMFHAPFGYMKIKNESGKSILSPHPTNSLIVQEIFKKMASGLYSAGELRKMYYRDLNGMSKTNFYYLLRRIVFTGQIEIQATENEPKRIVRGVHAPIITIDTFNQVQDILDGKKLKPRSQSQNVDMYPLKSFMYCNDHNRSFTGSGSTSRSKKIYHYYHCNISSCKHRFPIKRIDEIFIGYLSQLQFPNEIIHLYREVLEDALEKRRESGAFDKKELKAKKEKLSSRLSFLKDQYFDQKIDSQNFITLKIEIESEIQVLKLEEENCKSEFIPFKSLFDDSLRVLPDLVRYYREGDGVTKQKLVGSIFSGKIEFFNNEVRTIPFKDFIARIFLISSELQTYKMKKADKIVSLFNHAPSLDFFSNQLRRDLEQLIELEAYILEKKETK